MKLLTYIFLINLFPLTSIGQNNKLENEVLDYILTNSKKFNLDSTNKIIVNYKAILTPPSTYFTDRNFWHIKKLLSANCNSKIDTIENSKLLKKSFRLKSGLNNIQFSKKEFIDNSKLSSIYIYKRRYYCDNIYVVARVRNPLSLTTFEFLAKFDLNNKLLTINTQSYVR